MLIKISAGSATIEAYPVCRCVAAPTAAPCKFSVAVDESPLRGQWRNGPATPAAIKTHDCDAKRTNTRLAATLIVFTAVMPGIFMVVPMVIAIIVAFAVTITGHNHAGRHDRHQSEQ